MSSAADQNEDSHEVHEGPIKTPKQLIATVIASFVLPVLIIILLVNFVVMGDMPAAGTQALEAEAVASRIAPIAKVDLKDASDPASLKTGEQVYQAQCSACHNSGAAGAPKMGDAAGWTARLGGGYEGLLNSALKGKGAMGAQGGGDFSDYEIGRAVVYMVNGSGGKLAEPKAPAAAASAAKP